MAGGANYLARAHPEKFAAWLSLSPGIRPPDGDPFTGTAEQNLTTNLPGSPGVMQVMDLHSRLSSSERDIPFGLLVGGRNDHSLAALTADMIQAYQNLDRSGYGSFIYWDDRGHVYTEGSYWSGSYRQTSQALTEHRSDRSFPAFSGDDQDFSLDGQQPDMGNGDPETGDPWGTWGGYYGWETGSMVDTDSLWKAVVYLESSGDYPVDIPGFDSSMADISIRRPQYFLPADSGSVSWELRRLSDSRIIQSGWEKVGEGGLVTIPDVTIYKEKCELSVTRVPTSLSQHGLSQAASPGAAILEVYPNPAFSMATIGLHLAASGMVSIRLYDLTGRLAEEIARDFIPAGEHSIQWDTRKHPSGLYICIMSAGEKTVRKKIILLR